MLITDIENLNKLKCDYQIKQYCYSGLILQTLGYILGNTLESSETSRMFYTLDKHDVQGLQLPHYAPLHFATLEKGKFRGTLMSKTP